MTLRVYLWICAGLLAALGAWNIETQVQDPLFTRFTWYGIGFVVGVNVAFAVARADFRGQGDGKVL